SPFLSDAQPRDIHSFPTRRSSDLHDRDKPRQPTNERAVRRAMKTVSDYLGNTPAVCRASYVDPRVIDRYHAGVTIAEDVRDSPRSEEHTSELQSRGHLVCRLLLEK